MANENWMDEIVREGKAAQRRDLIEKEYWLKEQEIIDGASAELEGKILSLITESVTELDSKLGSLHDMRPVRQRKSLIVTGWKSGVKLTVQLDFGQRLVTVNWSVPNVDQERFAARLGVRGNRAVILDVPCVEDFPRIALRRFFSALARWTPRTPAEILE